MKVKLSMSNASITKSHFERYRFFTQSFVFGLIASQKLVLGGEIYIGEILAILYFISHIKPRQFSTFETRFFQLALVWSAAQLFSDVINQTLMMDSIKGVLAPIVFSLSALGLVSYFRLNLNKMPSFILGVAVGTLLNVIFFPDSFAQDNPWKWGVGSGMISIYAIYISFFQRRLKILYLILVPIVFFGISMFFSARSLSSFPIISMLIYLKSRNGKLTWFSKYFGGKWGITRLLAFVLPTIIVINLLLTMLFTSSSVLSNFSDDAAEKYRAQASGTYGILLGGRSEIIISSQAFYDSPWIGHGSWAHDESGKYLNEYRGLKSQLGYVMSDAGAGAADDLDLIPVHSYLMGGFVWAGILGGFFWLYLLNQSIKSFIRHIAKMPYYYHLNIILFIWNVFFSPFGASARWASAVFLASYFSYLYELTAQSKNKT